MAEWRLTGKPCPIDDSALALMTCRKCPYFRGAVSKFDQAHFGWSVNCNWPINGSERAEPRSTERPPVPKWMDEVDIDL